MIAFIVVPIHASEIIDRCRARRPDPRRGPRGGQDEAEPDAKNYAGAVALTGRSCAAAFARRRKAGMVRITALT
jgi:hypothetical protein